MQRSRFVTRKGPDTGNLEQIFGDAADCHAAWEKGEIVLRQTGHYLVSRMASIAHLDNDLGELDQPSDETSGTLGEDQGPWSSDGVCNDPRFAADPRWLRAVDRIDEAEGKDSTDCLLGYLSRQAWPIRFRPTDGEGLVFGDDSGEWPSTASVTIPGSSELLPLKAPACRTSCAMLSDCYEAWSNGHVTLILPVAVLDRLPAGFDLGGDTSEWAFDGECDDPRFEGKGMARDPLTADQARDATDCVKGLLSGAVELKRPRLQDGRSCPSEATQASGLAMACATTPGSRPIRDGRMSPFLSVTPDTGMAPTASRGSSSAASGRHGSD